jgi:hypothetical protein
MVTMETTDGEREQSFSLAVGHSCPDIVPSVIPHLGWMVSLPLAHTDNGQVVQTAATQQKNSSVQQTFHGACH